jgi:hypothetical protein
VAQAAGWDWKVMVVMVAQVVGGMVAQDLGGDWEGTVAQVLGWEGTGTHAVGGMVAQALGEDWEGMVAPVPTCEGY